MKKPKETAERTPEQLVDDIQQACKELGWNISMDVSTNEISGLVIGENGYIEKVLEGNVNIDHYEIYGYSPGNAN